MPRSTAFKDSAGRLPGLQLHLTGLERRTVTAEQVGLFLFDFSVAFELFRSQGLTLEEKPRLTKWHLYRGHRRVPPPERLVVKSIRMASPIDVVATTIALTASSAGAIWIAVQALERICMFPLNRRKAQLEIRKLELEVERFEREEARAIGLRAMVDERVLSSLGRGDRPRHLSDQDDRVVETIQRRLAESPIQIEDLDLEFNPDVESPPG